VIENLLSAMFGAILGALLGFFGSFLIWRLERRRQRRIAKMLIAINVRHWMTRTLWQMKDLQTFVDSDGAGGDISLQIKDFRFEQSLEQVALVEDEMAVKIFKLIHKKDDANAEVEAAKAYADDEDAIRTFRGVSGRVWGRALAIYDIVSAQVGWSDPAFSDADKAMMQAETDRYEQEQREQARGIQSVAFS
jgi:hypothetical protein